jgi:hypothetical protein
LTFWAQYAQNQVLREKLASAAEATTELRMKRKSLKDKNKNILEQLSGLEKSHKLLQTSHDAQTFVLAEQKEKYQNELAIALCEKSKCELNVQQLEARMKELQDELNIQTNLAFEMKLAHDALKSQVIREKAGMASLELPPTAMEPVTVSSTPMLPTMTIAPVATRVMGLLGHGVKKMKASAVLAKEHLYKSAPKSPSTPGTPLTTPPPTPPTPPTPTTPTTTPPASP